MRIHAHLPIFRLDHNGRCVLYAPGHAALVTPSEADALRASLMGNRTTSPGIYHLAASLVRSAEQAVRQWQALSAGSFAPHCLTIYLSNRCNCACTYCFAAPVRAAELERSALAVPPVIRLDVVGAAARLVARQCAVAGLPFRLVLHGGGEPTLHWELVQQLESVTKRIAADHGVGWWGHIATNGILAPEQLTWLARHFDHVGLSCDGPPDIQDRQRPLASGAPSSEYVERTARQFAHHGVPFTVRSTVTPATVERQTDIVRYAACELGARVLRFEPVYILPDRGVRFLPADASRFAAHFLAAQQQAQALGCRLDLAGVRLDEVHGPYCDVLRNVLHLTPDGTAVACFFATTGLAANGPQAPVSRWDRGTAEYVLDPGRIEEHRRRATQLAARCQDCLNAYHCTRECPEFCAADPAAVEAHRPASFRCLVYRKLAECWILQAAGVTPPCEPTQAPATRPAPPPADATSPAAWLVNAPADVDVAAILSQWEATRERFTRASRELPTPVWARRGYEHNGVHAWRELRELLPAIASNQPLSIYIHVPFCDRRCPFCDCYSVLLGRHERDHHDRFVTALLRELDAWSTMPALSQRSVTTVHFGGGTPNHLAPDAVGAILHALAEHFSVTTATELALESTSTRLTGDHLRQLREWGFTRLHVGVQTLEPGVRRNLGRRNSGDYVLGALAGALELGFVTSVDIIYGLPGQTLAGLLGTLEQLVSAGIHGISLYQLQRSDRNRAFLQRHGATTAQPVWEYTLFQAADQYLRRGGFRKNHFAHFARPPDTNLYYTHARRGEDLLALGPTADGTFGSYHYRHPALSDYLACTNSSTAALEGGVWESASERQVAAGQAALLTNSVTRNTLRALGATTLQDGWLRERLVTPGDIDHDLDLTGNGSWFINDMLVELAACAGTSWS